MADDYDVGYCRPPRDHQFKKGNQAARKRRTKARAISLAEIFDRALRSKRQVRRGGEVFEAKVADILVERLIQMMTTGSTRDLARIVELIERWLPEALAAPTESLEVSYHRADGSTVSLPPTELWEKP